MKLAQWYVAHLDFVINFQPANSTTVFVRAADGSMLELIESNAVSPGTTAMREPGLRHLAITVTDFAGMQQRLKEAGVKFLGAPETVNGNSIVFFADCDGNILHLLHREVPLP